MRSHFWKERWGKPSPKLGPELDAFLRPVLEQIEMVGEHIAAVYERERKKAQEEAARGKGWF
jgi:hypothetical protein